MIGLESYKMYLMNPIIESFIMLTALGFLEIVKKYSPYLLISLIIYEITTSYWNSYQSQRLSDLDSKNPDNEEKPNEEKPDEKPNEKPSEIKQDEERANEERANEIKRKYLMSYKIEDC